MTRRIRLVCAVMAGEAEAEVAAMAAAETEAVDGDLLITRKYLEMVVLVVVMIQLLLGILTHVAHLNH